MGMIYSRIAEKLSQLYREADQMPREPRDPTLVYDRLIYIPELSTTKLYFAGPYNLSGTEIIMYKDGLYLDLEKAIREVWSYLNETEKTELMATVLGGKNE